jgi:glucose/arabinose dehydrogenase
MKIMGRLTTATAATLATLALASASMACADGGNQNPATNGPSGSAAAPVTSSGGAGTSSGLRAARVARFDHPVEIKSAPGYPGLMFVVEQEGRIMVLRRGKKLARPFLNIAPKVDYDGAERGLLSVAFPPDYRRSKRFYVYFVDNAGNLRLVEYRRRNSVRARQHTARLVMRIAHPSNSNHNGARLGFLGHDLYFGTGDGGGAGDEPGNAQNLNSLLGKMIRIDPRRHGARRYRVPRSNPFVGRAGRDEIFAYGFRNPFRWSFDRTSSKRKVRIAIGDVGQDRFEEIDYLNLSRARGGNFGWNRREGFSSYKGGGAGTINPSLVLPHPPNCSVIGGLVVRDRSLRALRGRYVFTDFCDGRILSFKPHLGRAAGRPTGLRLPSVTSFGESLKGALFVTSLDGSVYRIRQ